MKTVILITLLLAFTLATSPSYTYINHIAAQGFASTNDHGNVECVLHISFNLNYYSTSSAYQFYLIAQANEKYAAAGETGIFCSLSIDAANKYTGSCYTLTVTIAADVANTKPWSLVASQGSQLYSYVSSESGIYGTDVVVRLGKGDWDFWNSTLGKSIVPWVSFDESTLGISLLTKHQSDFFYPMTIFNNCEEAYKNIAASSSSALGAIGMLFSVSLF